jgi:hypothetical protein
MSIAITEDHRALADTASDFLLKHGARGVAREEDVASGATRERSAAPSVVRRQKSETARSDTMARLTVSEHFSRASLVAFRRSSTGSSGMRIVLSRPAEEFR